MNRSVHATIISQLEPKSKLRFICEGGMDNESTKILEKIHTRLGWIAIWLFLLVCGVGIGY